MKSEESRTYNICSKTVMDTSDPDIIFDENNISNYYWDFQNKVKPNWPFLKVNNNELEKKIEKIKHDGKNKEFDCILGLSGGIDSSYMLHVAVKEFGLRPLVFHVDGGWNTETAVNNINNLVSSLNVELYTEVINWNEMKDFQLAMFKSGVPHLDIPQDMAFISVLYKFAVKYKIKHILNGGNIATESVLAPLKILYWGTDLIHIKDILKKYGTIKMNTYPFSSVFYHKFYLRYLRGLKTHKPLNYINFNKIKATDLLKDTYGWKDYSQKHFESRFTKFFEGYWLPTRFGWDMRRIQFSSLILSNQLSREEAILKLEQKPYDQNTINKDLNYIASKLGISNDELFSYHRLNKKYYYDYKNQKIIFDIGERLLSILSNTRRGGAF